MCIYINIYIYIYINIQKNLNEPNTGWLAGWLAVMLGNGHTGLGVLLVGSARTRPPHPGKTNVL